MSGFTKVNALDPALALLESHGHIRPAGQPDGPNGPGWPASPAYDVNPLWAPQKPHKPQNGGPLPDGGRLFAPPDDSRRHAR
jgi:hypothetical protein